MTEQKLKRSVGPFTALAMVMGTVIGGGVFFKTASVVGATHSVSLTLLAWIVAGILTICGGLTVAELGAAIPETGGSVQYMRHTYGPLSGFLLGWAEMLIYVPANMAALAIIFATQVIVLLHLSMGLAIPIAIAVVGIITLLNTFGSKVGGTVQSITLIFKLIPIFLIVVVGLCMPGHVDVTFIPVAPSNHANLLTAFSGGLLATMFAYEGWINIGDIAGEMKSPKKDIPKAVVVGLTFIMIIYVLVNWIFLKNMPIDAIAGNTNTASQVAGKLFGEFGGKLVTIGILVSVFGTINGYTMTGARIPYALAKDDLLPFSKQFKQLNQAAAPYVASLFILVIAIIMIILGSFDILTDMLVFVMWIFNCLLFLSLFILRKREPDLERPYKVLWYPVVPIVAIIGGLFIVVTILINQTGLAIVGLAITLLGIPVYYLHKKFKI
ncbi:APC family permease [Fructilactobacillus sanfranciscensis]|uniref:APC family permease n=1 Tax=Fructilactobacillus sanfranciscensis TaxID=1625 RepID=UPI000CD3DAEB|nr:amino acid permease [Fructilactobacillus sanfranciscensis]POH17753.1 amino acid permease [Fructilactobacillus sanfranciscensis]